VQKYTLDAFLILCWKMLNFEPKIDYSDGKMADKLAKKREGLTEIKKYNPVAEPSEPEYKLTQCAIKGCKS